MTLVGFGAGSSASMSATSFSVSRLPVPLPMAISSTLCLRISEASSACAPRTSLLRLERIDGRGVEQLAGGIDDGDLDAGADAGIEAHGGARAGGRRQQQVLQIAGEDADRLFLGAFAQLAHQVERQRHGELHAPGPAGDLHQPVIAGAAVARSRRRRRSSARPA